VVKSAINYRAAVSTYASLPLAGNTQGDVRTAIDTGIQYWWSSSVAAGEVTEWKILNDNIPSAIDDAEKLNIELESEYKAASLSRFKELTYVGKNLTAVNIYDGPAKTFHLFSKALTYVGKNLTQVVLTRISDGATLTKTLAYVGKNLVSVTIT
jgi:hypothetical protein